MLIVDIYPSHWLKYVHLPTLNLYRQQTPLYNNKLFVFYEKWHGQQNRFYMKDKSAIFQCEQIEYIPKA